MPDVRVDDEDGEGEGETGDDEERDLRPQRRVFGPGREAVAGREAAGGVEDLERCDEEGEDDEGAREVDAAEDDLCEANAGFDSLERS